MAKLKISVITVVRNEVQSISRTLSSIRSQTYSNIERIVVDAESTDGTSEIIQQFDPPVSLHIRESDRGIYNAMNKGLHRVSGDIVGFLNGGDMLAEESTIDTIVETMLETQVDICYGDVEYVNSKGRIVRRWVPGNFSSRRTKWGWMPPHPTFYARKEFYNEYGGFRTELRIAADYELMLRFLHAPNVKVAYLPRVLVRLRTGGVTSGINLANFVRGNYEVKLAWELNGMRMPIWRLMLKPLRKVRGWLSTGRWTLT